MAISYVSDIIKSNPLIAPFDINLMEKVNSYKQTLFYQNAAKAENMIGQLNNTDIANPEQRALLKGKVDNLTTQINNMGAINYSDMGISNAIESFGSDIYSDEKVMNGITSTRSMREWQSNVQKLKTDPKLSKYYNGANEAYDYEHFVKPYVTGGVDATYNGPRAPKPYTGNPFTKAMEIMKTIRPDIETRIDPVTGNQFFFSKTEKRTLSSQDIAATLDGFIDGDTKQQLKIDAWYNFDYSTGNKFDKPTALQVYTQDLDNVVKNKQTELQDITDKLTSEPDLNKKAQYQERQNQIKEDIATYTGCRNEMVSEFGKDWDVDSSNAKYKLYMKRFYNDVVRAAGYDETKISLIKNEERLFNARQQLEFTKEGLWWDGQTYNSDGTPLVQKIPNAESMNSLSKNAGKDKEAKTPLDPSNGIFHDLVLNTENNTEASRHKITAQSLLDENKQIEADQTKKLRNFLEVTSKRGGYDLGFKDSPESNANASAVISTSPLLEAIQSYGDKTTLTKSDVETFVKQAGGAESVRLSYNGKKLGVTKPQLDFFRNLMQNWDAVATGQLKSQDVPMNVSVSDLSSFVNEYQLLELNKQSKLAFIKNANEQALEGSNLTPSEKQLYGDYLSRPEYYESRASSSIGAEGGRGTYWTKPEGKQIEKIQKKIDHNEQSKLKKRVNDIYDNASNRLNYNSLYLPDNDALEKALPGVMAKIRAGAVNTFASDTGLQPEAIIRKDDNSFVLSYITHDKKGVTHRGEVKLAADEAIRLGGQLYPNEPLERLLTYQTSTGPLYTYSPVFAQPIKYSIEREGNERNSRTFIPYIYYNNEKIPVFATDKKGYQGSANAAEYLLKQYINNNAFKGVTMDQFVKTARTIANQ